MLTSPTPVFMRCTGGVSAETRARHGRHKWSTHSRWIIISKLGHLKLFSSQKEKSYTRTVLGVGIGSASGGEFIASNLNDCESLSNLKVRDGWIPQPINIRSSSQCSQRINRQLRGLTKVQGADALRWLIQRPRDSTKVYCLLHAPLHSSLK